MVVDSYELAPGRLLDGRYRIHSLLGQGWEGEVYRIVETGTGIERAVKIWFPQHRNRDEALVAYARKLDKLRHLPIVLQYHHHGTTVIRGKIVEYIVSELVHASPLADLQDRIPGKRFSAFEAMSLLRHIAKGIEAIHRLREYHGDLHSDNILVRRRGVDFEIKLLDFFHLGRPTAAKIREDVFDLVRLLHEMLGGSRHYRHLSPEIRQMICGLKVSLLAKRYRTAADLVDAIDSLSWEKA